MPKIPQYQSRGRVESVGLPKLSPGAFVAQGQAYADMGDKVARIGFALDEKLREAERVRELTTLRSDVSQKISALQADLLESPEFNTNPQSIRERWDSELTKLRNSYKPQDPEVQMHLNETFDRYALSHGTELRGLVRKKQIDIAGAGLLSALDGHEQSFARATSDVLRHEERKNALSSIDGAVASGIVSAEYGVKLKRGFLQGTSATMASQDVMSDPVGAMERISKREGFYSDLDDDKALQLIGRAENKIESLKAEAERQERKIEIEKNRMASSLWRRADDTLTSIAETGEEGPLDIESKLRALGTDDSLQRADEYRVKKSIAHKTHSVIHKFSDMPIAEQLQQVEQAFKIEPGQEGAHETVQAGEMAMRVVRDRQRRFIDDPAAYVMPLLEGTQGLTEEQKADKVLALQDEIGKGLRFQRSIFGKEEVKAMASRYEKMDATGKLEFVRGVQEYGKHANGILNSIGAGAVGQLASEADRVSPKNATAARTLIEAGMLKESEIPGDEKSKRDSKKAAFEALQGSEVWQGLTKLLEYQPQNSALRSQVNAMQTAIQNMGMMYGDGKKAVEFFDNTYSAIADDSLGYLVYPKQSTITPKQMAVQLEKFRQQVPGVIEWRRGIVGDAFHGEKVRDLTANGLWVNATDGNGYVLIDQTSGMPVTREDKSLFRVTLDDILMAHDADALKAKKVKETSDPSGMGGEDYSSGIVGGYNISRYATDPRHESSVERIYSTLKNKQDLHEYMKNKVPGTPLTGEMVESAANKYGVDPKMVVALMEQDSSLGTAGKGARTYNPGNVGNDDAGNERNYGSWQAGVDAVAKWLSRNKVK